MSRMAKKKKKKKKNLTLDLTNVSTKVFHTCINHRHYRWLFNYFIFIPFSMTLTLAWVTRSAESKTCRLHFLHTVQLIRVKFHVVLKQQKTKKQRTKPHTTSWRNLTPPPSPPPPPTKPKQNQKQNSKDNKQTKPAKPHQTIANKTKPKAATPPPQKKKIPKSPQKTQIKTK